MNSLLDRIQTKAIPVGTVCAPVEIYSIAARIMGVAVSKILRDFYICILGLRSVQLKAPLPTGKEAIALLYHFDYAPLRAYISLSPINR